VITDDEVMRIFERADPARVDDHAWVLDATGYLDVLRTRSNDMTIIETASIPTQPHGRRRWPAIAVAAAALVLIVVGVLVLAAREDATEPSTPIPTSTTLAPAPTVASADEIATTYLAALAAHDAEQAASSLSDGALTVAGGLDGMRLQAALDVASGFQMSVDSCEQGATSTSGTLVRCTYAYHGLRSNEIGLEPFTGSAYRVMVRDGKIAAASDDIEFTVNGFSPRVWEPFATWVSDTYPDDAAIMYSDSSLSDFRLTEESVSLWDRHTHEYVDEGNWTTQLAKSFLEAWSASDLERAAVYLTDDALAGLGSAEHQRLDAEWARASGFKVSVDACEQLGVSDAGTSVRCAYSFQGIRSDEMGLGPFGGSYDRFTVKDGAITDVSFDIDTSSNGFSSQVWEPFATWVSATYPDDAAIMYTDSSLSDYRLTEESIRLWEQRTQEYVAM
jgi:ketosteroid isomerase-like protein